jgi:hypothetical protein
MFMYSVKLTDFLRFSTNYKASLALNSKWEIKTLATMAALRSFPVLQ